MSWDETRLAFTSPNVSHSSGIAVPYGLLKAALHPIQPPGVRDYALQRLEALALCQGWYEQVDEAEGAEAAGYTLSYPTWLAPAAWLR